MEAASQPSLQGSNSNSRTGTPRGRGRGRFRKTPQTENSPTSKPASNVSDKFSETKHSVSPYLVEKASRGHFDNPEPRKSSTESPRSMREGSVTNTPFEEKGTTSDKENSCSPKTQRTRRAIFDSNVMSRITSHLQKGRSEISEAHRTGSLDILNKLRSHPRLVDSDLRIHIPGGRVMSGKSDEAAPHEKLIAEGRPRSMTDPVSPPSTGGWNGLLCTTPAASSKEPSVPSPLSVTKPRGRGRARGRARHTHHQETMEVTSRPGGASEHGSRPDLSQSQNKNRNHEQFSDAVSTVTGPSSDVHAMKEDSSVSRGSNKPASSSSEGGRSRGALLPTPAPRSDSGSRPSSGGGENSPTSGAVGGSGSESSAGGRSGKGLTLVIGKNSEQTPVTEPDLETPDDITLLLSPNHQYTLDWAAAMATPPASADSAPDWNTTGHY